MTDKKLSSASISDGLPHTMILETFDPARAEYETYGRCPQLSLHSRLHHLQTSAISSIAPKFMSGQESDTLDVIEGFDSQARMIQSQLQDEIGERMRPLPATTKSTPISLFLKR